MKKLLFLLLILATSSLTSFGQFKRGANWGDKSKAKLVTPTHIGPIMKFDEYEHEFGEIPPFTTRSYDFTFTNAGGQPLIVSNVEAACDCTSADYDPTPVMPGEEGKITVHYDSKTRYGKFHKVVTVFANTSDGQHKLYFGGRTLTKEEAGVLMPVSNKIEEKEAVKAVAKKAAPKPKTTAAKTTPAKASPAKVAAAKKTVKKKTVIKSSPVIDIQLHEDEIEGISKDIKDNNK